MENLDDKLLDEFIELIYKRIEQKFEKQLNSSNVEYTRSGVVSDVNGDTATIDIGHSVTEYISNKTGETLNVGDTVKVFFDKQNMVGAYIGVKLS